MRKNIYIKEMTYARLQQLATENDRNISQQIAELINEKWKEEKQK